MNTPTAKSTRRRSISGESPCCAFTGNGAKTKSSMVKHMHKTFTDLIETMGGHVTSPDLPATP